MAQPIPVVADTVGGDIEGVIDTTLGSYHKPNSARYSQVFEHYVSNAMDAYGYSQAPAIDPVTSWMVDEGWQIIPYWNPAVSMAVREFLKLGANASAVRVKSLGFTIKQAQMMRQETTIGGGIETVNNTFSSQPYFEIFIDSHNWFHNMVHPRPVNSTTFPLTTPGYNPNLYPNTNMTTNECTSFVQGSLKRTVWAGSDNIQAYDPPDMILSQVGDGVDSWSQFSTLNEGMRHLKTQDALRGWSFNWQASAVEWYPIRMPSSGSEIPPASGFNNNVPGTFPTRRNFVLAGGSPNAVGGGPCERGDNIANAKHNCWASMNLESTVFNTPNDIPPDVFIKINRLFDQEGPINMYARLLIEYSCELEWLPIDVPFKNNLVTGNLSTNSGQNAWLATSVTLGPIRRFRAWGVPNISQPPLASSGAYSQIYQPATMGANVGRLTKTKRHADPEPATTVDGATTTKRATADPPQPDRVPRGDSGDLW